VLDGVNKFRHLLRRDVTAGRCRDAARGPHQAHLALRHEQEPQEMDDIVAKLDEVEKNLGELVPYTIRYLRGLLRRPTASCTRAAPRCSASRRWRCAS
jgi:hypothetical protein